MNAEQLQAKIDSAVSAAHGTRSEYHVTLGKAIEKASQATGYVRFSDGAAPGEESSYRGYYSDLAFTPDWQVPTAQQFLAQCKKALGTTYTGYKGGDNVMVEGTPLWRAEYGSTGDAIVRAVVEDNGDLTLHCALEDD